jgi:mannose-6-phosphate isomerase-like protein (cupin superfamily)
MSFARVGDCPRNERGDGQVSHLLLAEGQFGSRNLAVTWVEGAPGSQQPLHAHEASEQAYVIVRGSGHMLLGDQERHVGPGTLVFIPPGTRHAIRNDGEEPLVYVSATSPPFPADVSATSWEPRYRRS